jgi:pyruvate dehydrogenase E1 component
VATPSGITLAPEGGAHQSIGTPLIGMAQDGLASFEPAFADELSVIMDWGFDYMQRDGSERADLAAWPRDVSGGSVYLRLSTRVLEQVPRTVDAGLADGIIRGAYWLQPPTPATEVVVAYQGVLADQAIAAAGAIGGERRNVAVLAVTSADRLNAGWHGSQRAQRRGEAHAPSHIETLLADVPRHAGLVTVIDGHPATLSWLGGVGGHRTISLGVEHFGQTGTVTDLYRHYGIDAEAIRIAAQSFFGGQRA